jgi:hypothetical protein
MNKMIDTELIEAFKKVFKKVYDEVNLKTNAGNSVKIKDFKNELKKVSNLKDDEIDEILLKLDDDDILHLQTADAPNDLPEEERKASISFEGRIFAYITWF